MDAPAETLVAQATSNPPLSELIASTGLDLDHVQVEQLERYRDLLFERNASTNLTAVRDLPGIDRRLILESLRLVDPLRAIEPIDSTGQRTMLDIGTGGGLPGMVLAIACPEFSTYLLDSTGKKIAFLDDVVRELGLENVTTIHARAEEIAHQPRYRNAFDLVTARAVTTLPALLELALPTLRTNGTMLLPKGVEIEEELEAGRRAAEILRGEIVSAELLPDIGSTVETRLVIARKLATTPSAYPRRSGMPSKNPLGQVPRAKAGRQEGST
jgi:16S rRNA (guanine527-N7)-methyltransferase